VKKNHQRAKAAPHPKVGEGLFFDPKRLKPEKVLSQNGYGPPITLKPSRGGRGCQAFTPFLLMDLYIYIWPFSLGSLL
jgi:hypothetical protein